MKWAEIAKITSQERYSVLSQFMKSSGIENSFQAVQVDEDGFTDKFRECEKDCQMIFIGTPYGEPVVQLVNETPAHILHLKACDTFIRHGRGWKMESATTKGFERILSETGSNIDLKLSVLIVGAGATARVVIYSFIKLGVKKFSLTNKFDDQAHALLRDLKTHYFDVEFEFVPKDRLVLLPGNHSVLVNTTPFIPSNDLLQELYYFNFLKSPGVVIDLTVFPLTTPLIKEAESIGIPSVRGYQIASYADVARLSLLAGKDFQRQVYEDMLKTEFEKMKFDFSPFATTNNQ